jgi:hypothetical protein
VFGCFNVLEFRNIFDGLHEKTFALGV